MEKQFILSKESSESEIKRYFSAILELSKSDNEFPIDLDEVWMLVYAERSKAIRALKANFIDGVDYKAVAQNGNGTKFTGNDYYLSLSCMEFFIARKVRSVFEVYRQVFHKTTELSTNRQLSPSELILQLAQINVDTERKMKELEGKQNLLEAKVNDIAMRTSTVIEESTVIGFAKRYDIDMSRQKASSLGRAASCMCTKRGYEMGRVNDPRFGYVKTYPDCILKEVFKQNYPHAKFG